MDTAFNKISGEGKPRLFYGYVIAASAFFLQALGLGMFNSFGVFITPLMTEFEWSRASITGAISFAYVITALNSILLGRLNDKFGPRLIMSVCGIFLAAGYLLMSRTWCYWSFFIFCCIFIGIGLGGTDVVLLSTIARWFIKKRGIMTGIVKVGTGAGMLAMPFFMNRLLLRYGWRNTLLIAGIIVLVLFFFFSQLLSRDPSQKGLAPDGLSPAHRGEGWHVENGLTFREAVKTRQFWTIALTQTLFYTCANTIQIHIIPHGIDLGLSSSSAASILSTLGALSIAGRFIMGGAGDVFGNIKALAFCFICLLTGLILLHFSHTFWTLTLFAVIHGFAHGGVFAVISPIIAELFGTVSHGLIFGIVYFISSIGGALGPLTAGHIYDTSGSYEKFFMVLAGISLAGLLATFTLKPVEIKEN